MKPPTITDLQFLVIEALRGEELAGHELRGRLAAQGARKDGPAFYQMMGRLERASLVEGRYVQLEVEGNIVKERRYKLRGNGELAYRAKLNFYSSRIVSQQIQGLGTSHV